jgi:LCP family protein required for cell wall assembly
MSFTVRPVREERKTSGRTWKYLLLAVALFESLSRLAMRVKKREEKEGQEIQRIHALKRTMMILVSLLLVLLLLIGTLKVLVRLKAISLSGVLSAVSSTLPADDNGFTNVLLLGVGDVDHDGADLTDTMIVASLDPKKTKSVVMLSLPRDTYVLSSEKMGRGRINSLYRDYKIELIRDGMNKQQASTEALKQLAKELSTLLNLPIHGVVKINFSGFEQAVDAIGGIDVVVPEDLVDPEYPGLNYSYETFSISRGPHHLSGSVALKYARSRHSTSDFSRSERQQQIIAAAAAKARANGLIKSPGKLTELMSIVAKNMETTFTTRELLGLADMGKQIDQTKIVSMNLSDQNGLYGGFAERGGFLYSPPKEEFEGASVLLPVSIPEFPVTWKQIHAFSEMIFGHRALFIRPPTIEVLNAGAKPGSAGKLGGELIRYGFNVIDTRNFARKNNPTFDASFIAMNPSLLTEGADGQNADRLDRTRSLADALLDLLEVKKSSSPVDPAAFAEHAPDLVIVLGKDFAFTPFQDLIR